ncbi:hypothetical protein K432DRAFT_401156 [Lepidopterella palustris CBS 459.81]|uniref:Uncharacterized protein n=1 Tax=Lepidopterella palustris CBS 459.81 TaxID=1314670 RepID=A0A8E2EIJ3_9PEZI|nr:hypothetical protein K432DRAFT_401156 [Lepidopterella palustris CBS 459.81]
MARAISSRTFLTCLALFSQCAQTQKYCNPPSPLNVTYKPNFAVCLATVEQMINTTFTDQARLGEWNRSGCFYGDPANGVLSLSGCYDLCGVTYEPWPWKDTFDRLSLWIIPATMLMAHLSFPPLHWSNYIFVILHAAGNPVDSLWSLLTRLKMHRRLRRTAESILPQDLQISEQVATVFAAYEEIGWQDVSEHFKKSYQAQRLDEREITIIRQASHELSVMRSVSMPSTLAAIATLIGTLVTAVIRTIKMVELENTRVNNETAHTIAVVSLLFISIPQVWLSARLGTFTTVSGAIFTIDATNARLREQSRKKRRKTPLFPPLQLAICPLQTPICRLPLSPCPLRPLVSQDCEKMSKNGRMPAIPKSMDEKYSNEEYSNVQFSRKWPKMASYMGMNSSWRPCKHLNADSCDPRPRQLLFISVCWVVFGACAPAVFLSATNHANKMPIGIGCRSLTWLGILGLWLFSFAFDYIFQLCIYRSSTLRDPANKLWLLWHCSLVKDGIITGGITTAVLLVQVGLYNSCWCRASFTFIVKLVPYTIYEWKTAQVLWTAIPSSGLTVIFELLLFVELRSRIPKDSFALVSWEHGSPLCKSGEQVQRELDLLTSASAAKGACRTL